MWEVVLKRSGLADELPHPKTDDEFDAAVGFILGKLFVLDGVPTPRRSMILGDNQCGAFLVPKVFGLADAWVRWKDAADIELVSKNRSSNGKPRNTDESSGLMQGITEFASDAGAIVGNTTTSALGAATNSTSKAVDATGDVLGRAHSETKKALASATRLADELLGTVQGLLASSLAADLNELLQATVKGSSTIYDMAMDAEYLRTSIGGGSHRMFDGGHTLAGAWEAVRDASPDDSFIEEGMGFAEAMFKDLTTPMGLPIANWDKAIYDNVAAYVQSNFGIPKEWFYDINSYDAPELLAGVIGLVSVIFSWKEKDTEKFSKLVGNMGVAAVFSANPILMIVTLTSLARVFHKAEHSGEYVAAVDSLLKGGIGTGATLAAASQIAVFGGPAGLALLAGLSAGLLANRATRNISIVQLHQFVMERTTAAATEIKAVATPGA